MNAKVSVERYTEKTHRVDELDEPSEEHVERLIASIRDDWSTTIEIKHRERTMMVSASSGRYAVMVAADGEFFDLVGDDSAAGDVAFVHGGQPAEHGARHLVAPEQAVAAAKAFLLSDDAGPPRGFAWEKQ
jgi:hypothetical protein